jgi:hypothetical protein
LEDLGLIEKTKKVSKLLLSLGDSFLFLEAATGFEPVNNGFADRCLSHLAMPPKTSRKYAVVSRGRRMLLYFMP